MRGKYYFQVRSKRIRFAFQIRRNITVIKGDSASGKTTLLSMMYEYLRSGRESGYAVSTDAKYYVYLRDEVGRDWTDVLYPMKNTIIFIEENNDFIFSQEFAEFVKSSGNYFVLVNRAPLKMLPYSIHEIYEIVPEGKHADFKEVWHTLREIYSNFPNTENNLIQNVLTEDSNAGFQFFSAVFSESNVSSAGGNGNIVDSIEHQENENNLLVIADGSAFGAIMENCMETIENQKNRRISLWLPESFEYLILKSKIVSSPDLDHILESPSDYIKCEEYISWERYFTDLLILLTKETSYTYSKQNLKDFYLTAHNRKRIIETFPKVIRDHISS